MFVDPPSFAMCIVVSLNPGPVSWLLIYDVGYFLVHMVVMSCNSGNKRLSKNKAAARRGDCRNGACTGL